MSKGAEAAPEALPPCMCGKPSVAECCGQYYCDGCMREHCGDMRENVIAVSRTIAEFCRS